MRPHTHHTHTCARHLAAPSQLSNVHQKRSYPRRCQTRGRTRRHSTTPTSPRVLEHSNTHTLVRAMQAHIILTAHPLTTRHLHDRTRRRDPRPAKRRWRLRAATHALLLAGARPCGRTGGSDEGGALASTRHREFKLTTLVPPTAMISSEGRGKATAPARTA